MKARVYDDQLFLDAEDGSERAFLSRIVKTFVKTPELKLELGGVTYWLAWHDAGSVTLRLVPVDTDPEKC